VVTYINNITTLAENAANAHTNFNSAMFQIDAMAQMSAINLQNAPPGSPSDGDIYLVDYTPNSQEWSGKGDNIAYYVNTTYPDVIEEWRFIAPKEGMQVFIESDNNVWLHFKGGTEGIGGGGWHYQYVSEISGHILEPYMWSSSQEHTFILCINAGDTGVSKLKTFEITSFHATLRTSTSPLTPVYAGAECKAVLEKNGTPDATTIILETDLVDNVGGIDVYVALVSKTGLSILIEPEDTLSLKIYDMTYDSDPNPENFRFSVHIRELQTT